ncbi:hypothetical protein ACDT12_13710, partial [Staphylococcus aureus]
RKTKLTDRSSNGHDNDGNIDLIENDAKAQFDVMKTNKDVSNPKNVQTKSRVSRKLDKFAYKGRDERDKSSVKPRREIEDRSQVSLWDLFN